MATRAPDFPRSSWRWKASADSCLALAWGALWGGGPWTWVLSASSAWGIREGRVSYGGGGGWVRAQFC